MAGGKASDDAGRDLEQLSSAIFQVRPKNLEDLALYQNALRLRLGRSAGLWRAARFVSVGDHHGKLPFSVAIGAMMKKTIDS